MDTVPCSYAGVLLATHGLVRMLLLVLLPILAGCPPPEDPDPPIFVPPRQEIGTWPTPEMNALGEEKCDGLDNDGDGAVDEGCGCTAERSCVAVSAGECVEGTQACTNGALDECVATGSSLGAAATPTVEVLAITPAVLTPIDATGPVVTVNVQPACAANVPPYAVVVLAAETPAMRVWAVGRDDGVAPDVSANDDVYTVELINPFGPGVPTQTMTVEAGARLDEAWALDESTLDWQAD